MKTNEQKRRLFLNLMRCCDMAVIRTFILNNPFQCVHIKAKQSGPKFLHRYVKRFRARTGDQVRVESYHPAAFRCVPSLAHLEQMNGWLGGFWRSELLLVREASL